MNTIPKLLVHQAQVHADAVAIRSKQLGIWRAFTWQQVLAEVETIACGFADLGVNKSDAIAIMGSNNPHIFNSITACQAVGAIPVPIYGNSVGEELAYMLNISGAQFAVAQDQQQVDALLALPGHALQQIIYISQRGLSVYPHSNMSSFEELKERGRRFHAQTPNFFAQAVESSDQETPGMVLFTSGVSGNPLAVQVKYKNMLHVATYIAKTDGITTADEVLSFMPISRATSLLFGYVMSHVTGLCVSCPENVETIMGNLCEINPTLLYGPPQVYKYIAASIYDRIDLADGLPRKLYDYYINNAIEKKRPMRGIGEVLVAGPIRDLYGLGKVRLLLSGGDLIPSQLFDFFRALDIKIRKIYGNTESFGCITLQAAEETTEDVGYAIEGMEIKISDEGEILCRGKNLVSSYLNNPQATQQAFDAQGWHRTGDVGVLEPSGLLHIYDRLNAVTVMPDKTKYMPKVIESSIKASPYVHEAFVGGGDTGELVAAVIISGDLVGKWAKNKKIRYAGYADLSRKKPVQDLIAEAIVSANATKAQNKQPSVRKFILFHRQLSFQAGEITLMSKLRRSFLQKSFGDIIQAAQSGKENIQFFDSMNKEQVLFNICQC